MAGFKRAISSRIVEQSRFLKLSATQQVLYMQLCLHADDEGVAEGRMSCLLCGAGDEDLQTLEDANFVKILNDDPVVFIVDWNEHNTVRSDRMIPSIYHELIIKATGKNESECTSNDNLTQAVDNLTQASGDEEDLGISDKSLYDKDLTQTDTNSCHSDVKCPQNDAECQPNTIQYNTRSIYSEKKKKIPKEKREFQLSLKMCDSALSRVFGHYTSEASSLMLEWMREKDPGTLDTWCKRAKDVSGGKLSDACEIISKSIRCGYKDLYPTSSAPEQNASSNRTTIVRDKTDQYALIPDESISL